MSRRNGSHGLRQQVGGSREPPITNSSQEEFQITKKIIAGVATVCAAACMTVTAFAETLIHFTVNNVKITGELSYFDSLGGNPFDNDSVTAITSSTSVMDHIEAHATLVSKYTLQRGIRAKDCIWQDTAVNSIAEIHQ